MTNRIRDASWIESVGYGSRHGPYARGEPLIRGKPPMGIGVSNSNITDLESPPPDTVISTKERSLSNKVAVNNMRFLSCFLRSPLGGNPSTDGKGARSWLQWESRVLAAKNNVGFFGNFIPNGDCYGKEEAPPNLPQGEEQEKREGGRPETEDRKKSQFSALKRRKLTARGNALGLKERTHSIAPRSVVVQGDNFAWGKINDDCSKIKNRSLSSLHRKNGSIKSTKENVEYRMMNNECRSLRKSEDRSRKSEALKERQATARGNALGSNEHTVPIAPRLNISQGNKFTWGKINDTHLSDKRIEKNIQYSTINIQCKSLETEAPTERNLTAQGAALCNESNADFVVPRSAANYCDTVTWGKTGKIEYCEELKNRSLSSQYIKNGSLKREESFQSQFADCHLDEEEISFKLSCSENHEIPHCILRMDRFAGNDRL